MRRRVTQHLDVQFRRSAVARTEELNDSVAVDYDAEDQPLGVEFLNVSSGIELNRVPSLHLDRFGSDRL